MPVPDFSVQNNFPIASVIQAAQENANRQQQAQQYGQQQLVAGLQSIGQVGQSLLDRKRAIAQAMTMGTAFGMTPEETQGLMPDQVEKVGQIKQGQVQMGALLAGLHPELAKDPTFMTRFGLAGQAQPSPAQPVSQPGSAQPSQGGAMLTGGLQPPATQPPATASAAPAPIRPPMLNKTTAGLLTKIALATRQEPVITQAQALQAGSVTKGARIINPATGASGQKEQDTLENQAINRISGIRGDTALKRIEEQRDASIQVYNTAATIRNENRLPNQLEYYDMIGQMWKARTGQSPSDQAIRDLDAKTFQGDLGKAYQYFSGKAAPRTTSDILGALQNFADTSGKQADQLHQGYMKTHTIKPSGLSDDRWKPIVESQRGLSFEDATKGARQPQPDGDIHDQALQWAQSNPNDPRAAAIIQKAKAAKGPNIGI